MHKDHVEEQVKEKVDVLSQCFGCRKIKNMICARLESCGRQASGGPIPGPADSIIFFALRHLPTFSEIFASAPTCSFRHPPAGRDFRQPPFRKDFSIKHFQNFNTVSFKELHPLLLVSIPFQTNKINIRLSVFIRSNFTSQRQLRPLGLLQANLQLDPFSITSNAKTKTSFSR